MCSRFWQVFGPQLAIDQQQGSLVCLNFGLHLLKVLVIFVCHEESAAHKKGPSQDGTVCPQIHRSEQRGVEEWHEFILPAGSCYSLLASCCTVLEQEPHEALHAACNTRVSVDLHGHAGKVSCTWTGGSTLSTTGSHEQNCHHRMLELASSCHLRIHKPAQVRRSDRKGARPYLTRRHLLPNS